ncbi:hypothetical protein AJ79_00678 [Helicocarpus griseus UAMH5409]|uniref:Methyltransferase n=1 Tax=Helicocarpus griseus UAMH5409 TaxID=1447875 RepID=A0A2B7YB08_9EURO|nr:hypothetical protein AJ79_00678 [Helicocarpus griseus UAMH5409]
MAVDADTAVAALPNLEADDTTETDSTYDGSIGSTSYATSLASSVKNYVYANGRRYNAFRAGEYMLPNDEDEQARMDLTHHIYKLLLGGAIYTAPIKANPQRVLDIGTGTGIWAIDFADEHPESQVIGNDLSPIQPSWIPSNCMFEIDDLESEWPYTRPFDFIHAREMAGSISDFDRLFKQAYDNLVPGGYFEIQSIEPNFYSDDGSYELAKDLREWVRLEFEASSKFGKPLDVVPSLPGRMKKAGFEDVSTQVLKLPVGNWPKDKHMKEVGRFQQVQMLQALEPYSLFLFTKVLGWTVSETQVLIAGVQSDLKNRDVHVYSRVHFTRGRKPEKPAKSHADK